MRKMNKTAFTLVELIVVITILAILATVAFISLGGQTNNARNTVKKDAIGKLATAVQNAKVNGVSVMAFAADNVNNLTAGNIAGQVVTDLATSNDYKAGKINYPALNVKADDFKDKDLNEEFRVGVSTKNGGKFEFAATLKNDAGNTSYLAGNYNPRTQTNLDGAIDAGSKNFKLTNATDIKKISKGDIVEIDSNGTFEVKAISDDFMTITLDNASAAAGTTIQLKLGDEVEGLIGAKGNLANPVKKDTGDVPY